MRSSNEVVRAILTRRSIRFGFDRTRSISPDLMETITDCGLAAPSSKNAKPWRFHVVTSTDLLDEIAGWMESAANLETYVPHDPRTGQPHEHWQSTVIESAAVFRQVPVAVFIENRGVFSGGRPALRTAAPEALAGSLCQLRLRVRGHRCGYREHVDRCCLSRSLGGIPRRRRDRRGGGSGATRLPWRSHRCSRPRLFER